MSKANTVDPVTQEWVDRVPWKQQSILFSGLRGPDVPNVPATKKVNRWMRSVCQYNADPSKAYMQLGDLPDELVLCEELEFMPVHYVHHLADALAVIAYGHTDPTIAAQAARYYYRIAEELFHFQPEAPWVFALRHRDKRSGYDPQATQWQCMARDAREEYIDSALERFNAMERFKAGYTNA